MKKKNQSFVKYEAKKIGYRFIVAIFIFLALILWFSQQGVKSYDKAEHLKLTDSHGCLINLGQVWCEDKGKCLYTWIEDCPSYENQTIIITANYCIKLNGKIVSGVDDVCDADENNMGEVKDLGFPAVCCLKK